MGANKKSFMEMREKGDHQDKGDYYYFSKEEIAKGVTREMEPNFEQIKKICYRKGATDGIAKMCRLKHTDYSSAEVDRLLESYNLKNILIDNELDEAQQKSE